MRPSNRGISKSGKVSSSDVSYDTKDHLSILFEMHGSVWKHVVVFCLVNVSITFGIFYLRDYEGIDLTFKDKGHSFMSILVSFLVVSRSQIVYNRYMEARQLLGNLFRITGELMQHVVVYTADDNSDDAREWRRLIATELMILLNVTTTFLSYRSDGKNVWDTSDLDENKREALEKLLAKRKHFMGEEEANSQAPILVIYNIRKLIARNNEYLQSALEVPLELKLYANISDFSASYYGLKKLITTPFPFPLVQMARTFLYFWIFTLPFALVMDMQTSVWATMMTIFFLTYGYVGLEFVSIEMDDPFGDDPNDFKHVAMKIAVFEDIYLLIYDVNGPDDANALRFGEAAFTLENYFSESIQQQRHRRKHTEIDDVEMALSYIHPMLSDRQDSYQNKDSQLGNLTERLPMVNASKRESSVDSDGDVFFDALSTREHTINDERNSHIYQ